MQIFLPERDVLSAVRRLDRSRAGNQCWRESKTILNRGWAHHPVHKLLGSRSAGELAWFCYYNMCLIEHVWEQRWCAQATYERWRNYWHEQLVITGAVPTEPAWLAADDAQTRAVISSHRSCLLAKDFDWYSQFGWPEKPTLKRVVNVHGVEKERWPYVWPETHTVCKS